MRNVKRARQALHDNQQAWNSTMHRGKEEVRQEPEEEVVTLYTLAPASLDKPGTVDVGGYWLYSDDNVPEQVLREVVVDRESSVAQLQAYRLKIPYITFSEEGLQKALVKGTVYRADNGTSGVAFDPIKAAIELSKNKKEDTSMAKKPVVKLSVATKPVATITEVEHAGMPKPVTPQVPTTDRTPLGMAPACRALDAILAAPIVASGNVSDPIMTGKAHPIDIPKKSLPLPIERTEDAIVAGMELRSMSPDMYADMYRGFLRAFKQALQEEGLVIVPAMALHGPAQPGCGEEAPTAPVPVPFDPLADSMASILEAAAACVKPQTPAKAKSTLVLGPGVGKAPKAPVQDIPGNNGKVPVDTIIAIQTAWKHKTATQAELAAKYGIDDKKVWYLVNRAKSLI